MKSYARVLAPAVLVIFLMASRRFLPDLYRADDAALLHSGYARMEDSAPFERALARDPASPFRWSDLGASLDTAGDAARARYCYDRAVELGPKVMPILLRAANFSIGNGDMAGALQRMAAVLKETAGYDTAIFSYYRRLDLPIDRILRDGIPPDARAAQAYFRSLLIPRNEARLRPVWTWLNSRGYSNDFVASQYAAYLVAEGSPESAVAMWTAWLGPRAVGYGSSNFLFNGGFESEPVGGPFDWTIRPSNDASAARDATAPYAGAGSLRIQFRGAAGEYAGVSQMAVLQPGRYSLRARMRAEQLPAGALPRLHLFDAAGLDVSAPAPPNVSGWTSIETAFAVTDAPRLVTVQIECARCPSATLSVDAVELSAQTR